MGKKNVILTKILVILIVAHVSNADFLWNFRRLADSSPKEDPNSKVAPIPSPVGEIDNSKDKNNQTSLPLTPEEKKPKEELVKNIPPPPATPTPIPISPSDTSKHDDSPKDNVDTKGKKEDDEKNPKEDVKEEKKPSEICDGMERRCKDEKSMVACIKSSDDVSKTVVLLIQNNGENSLKVDLSFSSSENKQKAMEIPKLQTKQVNIPLAKVGGNEIKLNAGNGYCVIDLNQGVPVFQGNFYQWNPSYSKFMTPMYGAYLMLLITLIAGGVCACCWFSKRKRTTEVPYQELEMSMPESAADVATADGWDEVWDDDWDEEKAVKSPGHSVSANGLTSRTPKKDGWEDWDD